MRKLLDSILMLRLWPLMIKELRQIGRNRRLVISLIIPPTLQILIFGFALNPEVTNLRMGIVDISRSAESRELISAFGESRAFQVDSYYSSSEELSTQLSKGNLDIGLVIPGDFARKQVRQQTADVQLVVDAVNANTAAIAGGYAVLTVRSLNEKILQSRSTKPKTKTSTSSTSTTSNSETLSQNSTLTVPNTLTSQDNSNASITLSTSTITSDSLASSNQKTVNINVSSARPLLTQIVPQIALLFNPGLRNSWFIITGTLGILLILNGSIVSAASMIKEKEVGTIEQLLMTPATTTEITIAKICPLFILLLGEVILVLLLGYFVFEIPVRGSLVLLIFSGALCVLAGIGIGITIATFTHSQQQAQLMGFFVNPPISMLSGATFPVEGMPHWMQSVTLINPVRHFSIIARGVMLKGIGLDILYPNLLVLVVISLLLIGVSSWRFRKHLS